MPLAHFLPAGAVRGVEAMKFGRDIMVEKVFHRVEPSLNQTLI